MNDLIQAVHDWHANRPVDRIIEKFLVEICASHAEGKSPAQIARDLGMDKRAVKAVIATEASYAVS